MRLISIYIGAALLGSVAMMFSPSSIAQYNYYASSSFLSNQFNYPSLAPTPSEKSSQNSSASKIKTTEPQASANITRRPSATNNPLPYTRDKALSAQIRDTFLTDYAKQIPSDAQDMRDFTKQTDVVQVMAAFVQSQGLDSGTMEGVMAFWYGQAWAITHQKPLPSPQQYQGIANQLRASISKSSEWGKMSNEKRQTIIEQLLYPLFVQKANYQAYLKHGKKDSIARMSTATQEGLKRIGLDLQNLKLGDSGFVGL